MSCLGSQWRKFSTLALALAPALSALSAAPAGAELPAPRLWLAPTTHDGSTLGQQLSKSVLSSVKEYIAKNKRFLVEDGKAPKPRTADDPRVGQAESYKHTAIEAFRAGKMEEARETLVTSINLYKAAIASLSSIKSLYQALTYLAAANLALEYDGDAKDVFRDLAAVLPDDFEWSDDITEAIKQGVAKERKSLAKKKTGGLSITTEPSGATVRIDGVERCKSPCEVKELLPRAHYIQVEKEGAGKAGGVLTVKAGFLHEMRYTLALTPIIERAEPVSSEQLRRLNEPFARGEFGTELRGVLEEISTEQEVQGVLLSHLVTTEREMTLFAYLYILNQQRVFAVTPERFRPNLSGVKIAAMKVVMDMEKIVPAYPEDRVVGESHEPFKVALAAAKVQAAGEPVAAVKPLTPFVAPTGAPPPKVNLNGEFGPNNLPPPSNPALLPSPEIKGSPKDSEGAWYTSPWLWTGVGAVVLGAVGTAGYIMYNNQSEYKTFTSEVAW